MQREFFIRKYHGIKFEIAVVSEDTIEATAELEQGTYLIEGTLQFTYEGRSPDAREGVWRWQFGVLAGAEHNAISKKGSVPVAGFHRDHVIVLALEACSEAMYQALQEAKDYRCAMLIQADDRDKKLSAMWDALQQFETWNA